jgi:hypothetical protein
MLPFALYSDLQNLLVSASAIRHCDREAKSAVLNFGYQTNWLDLEKSARQGDPVAAYIFVLVLEVLLNRIRRLVNGLNLDSGQLVALAFADDLTLLYQTV